MKKYLYISFIFVFVFSLYNFNVGSVNAYYDSGCSSAGPYSTLTGSLCSTASADACMTGDLYSKLTGQACSGAYISTSNSLQSSYIRDLRIGSRGDGVKAFQQILRNAGYTSVRADGVYGPITNQAAISYHNSYPSAVAPYSVYSVSSSSTSTTDNSVTCEYAAPPYGYHYEGGQPYPTCGARLVIDNSISSTNSSTAPYISYTSPTSGPVGTQITAYGSGFTQTGNRVQFGSTGSENNPNYIFNSPNGRTITIEVPYGNYYACQNSNPPCYPPTIMTQPGKYAVSVINSNGTSNAIEFTVTQ